MPKTPCIFHFKYFTRAPALWEKIKRPVAIELRRHSEWIQAQAHAPLTQCEGSKQRSSHSDQVSAGGDVLCDPYMADEKAKA